MVVEFFKALADHYNEINKCGFCWEFGAPLSQSGMNKQIAGTGKQCCVNLFVTDMGISSTQVINPTTGLVNNISCEYDFEVYAVQQRDDIGQNTYNEIPGHDISSSLWAEVYGPLANCLGCDKELFICELGFDFVVTFWRMTKVTFQADRNFTGWRINGRMRITNIDDYKSRN